MDKNKEMRVRRDPFNEVLPLDELRIAAELIGRRQIAKYWLDHPTPLRPLGRLKFETLRQVAVFALPVLLVVIGYALTMNAYTLLALVPAALGLGYMLDRQLMADIERMRDKDYAIDRGRYHAVRKLSAATGIPAGEITLDMIKKMALDFVDVTNNIEAHEAALAAAAHKKTMDRIRREEAASFRRRDNNRGRRHNHGSAAAATAATLAAVSYADLADDDGVIPDRFMFPEAQLMNPSTGLPMIHGANSVDVGGNAFGAEPM